MRRHGRVLAIAGAIVLFGGIFAIQLALGDVAHVVWLVVTYALLGGLLGHFVERSRRAQRQLEETESEYRVLLERVPAIVYTAEYGPAGHWSYVSPKVESILGYSVEEWLSRPELWYERLHPDDRHQALTAEERSKGTGEELDSEYRISAKDGQVRWFRDQATVVHDEDGRPLMMQGVMLDITSRKRAEDELELRYAVQKGLADAASLNEGLHGVLRTVAVRFGWKLGTFWTLDEREEELKLSDIWHADDIRGHYFEDASRALRIRRDEGLAGRAWAEREPIWVTDTLTESNVARLETLEACGLRSAVACPVVSGNHVRGVVEFYGPEPRSVDPDVMSLLPPVCALLADFVATRAALEEHRGRFQAVLDNAPAVVFAKDLKGRYLFVNQRLEEVIGLPAEQIEGRTNFELFPADVAEMLADHDRAVLAAGHQQEFEEVVPHADGLHTYLTVKFPLRDALGTVNAVCGISTDVTELKRVQSELDERAVRELADGRVLISDPGSDNRVAVANLTSGGVRRVGNVGAGPREYRQAGKLFALTDDSTLLVDSPQLGSWWLLLHHDSIVRNLPPDLPALLVVGKFPSGVDSRGLVLGIKGEGSDKIAHDRIRLKYIVVVADRKSSRSDRITHLRGDEFLIRQGGTRERPFWGQLQLYGSVAEQATMFPDGWIGVVRVEPYRVEWRTSSGSWIRGPEIPWEWPRSDAKEKAAALERLRRRSGEKAKQDDSRWADRLAPISANALIAAPEGQLFVLRSQWSRAEDTRYDIFDRSGQRIAQLALPDSERVVGFGTRSVYVSVRDNEGFQRLRRHPWP